MLDGPPRAIREPESGSADPFTRLGSVTTFPQFPTSLEDFSDDDFDPDEFVYGDRLDNWLSETITNQVVLTEELLFSERTDFPRTRPTKRDISAASVADSGYFSNASVSSRDSSTAPATIKLAPDSNGLDIPLDAKWTVFERSLLSVEVLDQDRRRYEA